MIQEHIYLPPKLSSKLSCRLRSNNNYFTEAISRYICRSRRKYLNFRSYSYEMKSRFCVLLKNDIYNHIKTKYPKIPLATIITEAIVFDLLRNSK